MPTCFNSWSYPFVFSGVNIILTEHGRSFLLTNSGPSPEACSDRFDPWGHYLLLGFGDLTATAGTWA